MKQCEWCGKRYDEGWNFGSVYCSRRCQAEDPHSAQILANSSSGSLSSVVVVITLLLTLAPFIGMAMLFKSCERAVSRASSSAERDEGDEMVRQIAERVAEAQRASPAPAEMEPKPTCREWRYTTRKRGLGRRPCEYTDTVSCGQPSYDLRNCEPYETDVLCECP